MQAKIEREGIMLEIWNRQDRRFKKKKNNAQTTKHPWDLMNCKKATPALFAFSSKN